MDDIAYTRLLVTEAKAMGNPPRLTQLNLYHAIVAIEAVHPWWITYNEDDITGDRITLATIDSWTVLNTRITLQTEDGTRYQITSQPYNKPVASPLGYLKLERITP